MAHALTRRHLLSAIGVTTMGSAVGAAPGTVAAASAAPPTDARFLPADAAHRWIAAMYDAVVAEGLTPPNAARVYAYCAIAMYEAAVPAMPQHRSLVGQLTGLNELSRRHGRLDWPSVASGSIATVAADLLATGAERTLTLLATTHADVLRARRQAGVPPGLVQTSAAQGRALGEQLNRWIADDGWRGIQDRPYAPTVSPSAWESTPPNFGTAIEPYWAEVRPLILRAADEVGPEPHDPFSDQAGSAFHDQAMITYTTSQQLTDDQRSIARFWTDNPRTSGLPSGHWMLIVSQLSRSQGMALDRALEAYVRPAVALHDAFTNCWTWKYRFNLIRPVTYVRRYIDPTWSTFVNTPQFPEYTSGHSVASGAAATVLTELLGTVAFTDDSHAPRSLPARHFSSIWDAATEAATSRLYGGIHYPMGIERGVAQGSALGDLVNTRLVTRS